MMDSRLLRLLLIPALLLLSSAAWASQHERAGSQLELIESFYREGEDFRTETEILRFLHLHPEHPRRGAVELTRAKLYYREGRYSESSLMLFSLLDRHPGGEAADQAGRLLSFSLLREGRLEEAGQPPALLPGLEGEAEPLDELREPPAGAVPPERAVAWSTWLPGTGFFLLDQPGKAAAAMGLNLFFIAATALAWQEQLYGAALIFLITESALYRGGREAVREAAGERLTRLQKERTGNWLRERGEDKLLRVGLRIDFGGR